MIPMLIMLLIRKVKKSGFFARKILARKKVATKLIICLGLFLVCSMHATNGKDEKSVSFKVVKNEKEIGTIKIDKSVDQSSTVYNLSSEISTRVLLKFHLIGKETSIYKSGLLVYSSVFRKYNNSIKADHKITFQDGQYFTQMDNSTKVLDIDSIERNLVTLYFEEPVGVVKVFCDNENEMVPVTKVSESVYKVQITKSKYNIFHYKNGKCVKVEAVSSLFKVNLILK